MTSADHSPALSTVAAASPSVGLIGWRGMVGSVLMQRMVAEGDFAHINPVFFSTSAAGRPAPEFEGAQAETSTLQDAYDVDTLAKLPIIVTMQGGDYTKDVYPNSVRPDGTASGSTQPRLCAWPTSRSLSWTPSTGT